MAPGVVPDPRQRLATQPRHAARRLHQFRDRTLAAPSPDPAVASHILARHMGKQLGYRACLGGSSLEDGGSRWLPGDFLSVGRDPRAGSQLRHRSRGSLTRDWSGVHSVLQHHRVLVPDYSSSCTSLRWFHLTVPYGCLEECGQFSVPVVELAIVLPLDANIACDMLDVNTLRAVSCNGWLVTVLSVAPHPCRIWHCLPLSAACG